MMAAVVASCPTLEPRRPASFLPKMKSSVAPNISQGSTRRKVQAGVCSRSTAPAIPPVSPVTIRGTNTRVGTSNRLRYAPPLAAAPVHRASVFVALAGIGGTPVNSKAGKATKLPPPATAFKAPPTILATNRKMACSSVKAKGFTTRRRPMEDGRPASHARTTARRARRSSSIRHFDGSWKGLKQEADSGRRTSDLGLQVPGVLLKGRSPTSDSTFRSWRPRLRERRHDRECREPCWRCCCASLPHWREPAADRRRCRYQAPTAPRLPCPGDGCLRHGSHQWRG